MQNDLDLFNDNFKNNEHRYNMEKQIFYIFCFLLLLAFIIMLILIKNKYTIADKKYKKKKDEIIQNTLSNKNINEINTVKENILDKIDGIETLGKIYIQKINMDEYILKQDKNISNKEYIYKYINEESEFGENVNISLLIKKDKSVLEKLNNLDLKDNIIIFSKSGVKYIYKITKKIEINKEDFSQLISNNTKKELTLIFNSSKENIVNIIKSEIIEEKDETQNLQDSENINMSDTENKIKINKWQKKFKITSEIYIREEDNYDSQVVGVLNEGDIIKSYGQTENKWLQIIYEGKKAYIIPYYAEEIEYNNDFIKTVIKDKNGIPEEEQIKILKNKYKKIEI